MSFTFLIVLLAIAVLQMVLGMLWYGPKMFGNLWMKITGGDKHSESELEILKKKMMPYYVLQFFLSIWSAFVTINIIAVIGVINPFIVAGFLWLGFLVPMIIQSVIWGGSERKYWTKQIAIMSGYQFLASMITASVFYASVIWF